MSQPRSPRVLHVLAQRPLLTGSGITLDSIVREAGRVGWDQHVIVGVPHGEHPAVGGLGADRVHCVEFGAGDLPFAVPGMSDVMPYESTRWRDLDDAQWVAYREAWTSRVRGIVADLQPDLIHSHHVWLVSALLGDAAPGVPVVTHCHATGLRQMQLCVHRADEVRRDVARNARFVVLHEDHGEHLCEQLGVDVPRVSVVGAGYREDQFRPRGLARVPNSIVYAGKISAAKGVGELVAAFELLRQVRPDAHLHVAGSGAGAEADELRARLESLGDAVTLHGHVAPEDLAELMSCTAVFVLPSFYEGLPLVLVEAVASGCRVVTTALPGVVRTIAPHVHDALHLVDLPELDGPDRPTAASVPAFVSALADALDAACAADPTTVAPAALEPFTWRAVFHRVELVWRELLAHAGAAHHWA